MKQILLTISFLLFTGCVEYTVKVEADDVEINGEGVENGKCVTYTKAFFGWLGDFPLNIKVGEEKGEYEEGNYVVSAEVKSTEEACEEDDVTAGGTNAEQTKLAEKLKATEALVKASTALTKAQDVVKAAKQEVAAKTKVAAEAPPVARIATAEVAAEAQAALEAAEAAEAEAQAALEAAKEALQ